MILVDVDPRCLKERKPHFAPVEAGKRGVKRKGRDSYPLRLLQTVGRWWISCTNMDRKGKRSWPETVPP
jgi:hypothetical protein